MTQLYDDASSTAAALLQLARRKGGLSQRELAERASVPTTMISAYERGKRQPTLPTLSRLLHAAGFELRMRLEPYEPAGEGVELLDAGQSRVWRRATPAPPSPNREASAESRSNPDLATPSRSGA